MNKLFIVLSFLCINGILGSEFSDAMKQAITARKAKDYSSAISAYTTALEHCKNDSQKLSCLFNLANSYFSNKQYQEAIPYLDQIIALEDTQNKPNDARINSSLNFKINSYKALEQYQDAMDTLSILIQRDSVSEGMKNSAKKEMQRIADKQQIALPANFEKEEKQIVKKATEDNKPNASQDQTKDKIDLQDKGSNSTKEKIMI